MLVGGVVGCVQGKEWQLCWWGGGYYTLGAVKVCPLIPGPIHGAAVTFPGSYLRKGHWP